MATVSLRDVTKVYTSGKDAGVCAVQGIDLEVTDGEFMVLVGPSGCGKSTTLRMIAGLEDISSGTIAIGDRVVNDVPAKDRDIAMVFQNYALYPHMSVYENMAFGLRLRRVPQVEIDRRVREAAALLGLEALLARRPQALSGGQRQRVAVGRAIVRQPRVFLFDEPLSNLDAKMRVSTRTELSRLHARLGATMIYVTHDQSEAMTMGDRICVMRDGRIVQVAPPLEVYDRPANLFVASFIGSPAMNLIPGTLARDGSQVFFCPLDSPASHRLLLPSSIGAPAELTAGRAVVLGLRPEAIALTPAPADTLEAGVDLVEPMGSETFVHLRAGRHALVARVAPHVHPALGERLRLALDLTRARLFDEATGHALAPFSPT